MRFAAPEGHSVIRQAFVGQRLLVAEDEPLIAIDLTMPGAVAITSGVKVRTLPATKIITPVPGCAEAEMSNYTAVELKVFSASEPKDFDDVFRAIVDARAGALLMLPNPMFYGNFIGWLSCRQCTGCRLCTTSTRP